MAKGVRVRMRSLAAGPLGVWQPGTEVVVSEAMARQLLDGGYAEPVGARPPEAQAPAPPLEEEEIEEAPPAAARGRRQGG